MMRDKKFLITKWAIALILLCFKMACAITQLETRDSIKMKQRDYSSREWIQVEATFTRSERYEQKELRGHISEGRTNKRFTHAYKDFFMTFSYYKWVYTYEIDGIQYNVEMPEQELEKPENQMRTISVKTNDSAIAVPYANEDDIAKEEKRICFLEAKEVFPYVGITFGGVIVVCMLLDLCASLIRQKKN